ncbi:MAG: peptide deformylase [Bacteroidetes bacterium]|nr:peptide deformylase [Bacteroidota bacterium]
MVLEITQIGNPVLRDICVEVPKDRLLDEDFQAFVDDLIETKRHANGAGIAAPQVGEPWRIFVVEVKDNPRYPYKPEAVLTVCINPKITFLTKERYDNYEGCLSIPDLRGKVPRCPLIRVEALDRNGKKFTREVKGITAGTFQHENDHLDGILFPDRVTDYHSLSTWAEFKLRQEDGVRTSVEAIVAKWGE